MSRLGPGLGLGLGLAALALLFPLAGSGCASLVDLDSVLERMEKEEVDTVLDKLTRYYPQAARVLASESFVFVLDSVVVGRRPEDEAERDLIRVFANYMLGEQTGRGFTTRVEGERAVYGEGAVILTIYRGPDGKHLLLDVLGNLTFYLPLPKAGGEPQGVEAVSFDLRAGNHERRR